MTPEPTMSRRWLCGGLLAMALGPLSACAPTVQVAAEKPIEINVNVKIEHEIRVKVDRDLEEAIAANDDIF